MSLVCRPLADLATVLPVGGKARGLQLAADAGLRTPPSLVVFDDRPAVPTGAECASTLILGPVVEEALDQIRMQGWKTLAVRSSGQVEDGLFISFAGQWKSFPRVDAASESLETALRGVMAGPQTPSLQAYARHFGISLNSLQVAVLIQPWISAQCAGVAFSLNPVSGEKQLLVEVVPGTAENLMEGTVDGRRLRLNPSGEALGNGCEDEELSALQRRTLSEAVERLERVAGWPVDVEWAWDDVGLVILQVRPVTAFETPPDGSIAWNRDLTAERYPQPLSPLGWTNIKAVFDEGVRGFAAFMGMPLADKMQLAAIDEGWVVANPEAFDFKRRFKVRLTPGETVTLLQQTFGFVAGHCCDDGLNQFLDEFHGLLRYVKSPGKARTKLGNRAGSLTHKLAGTSLLLFLRRVAGQVSTDWPATLACFREQVTRVTGQVAETEDPVRLLELGDQLRKVMVEYIRPDLVIFAVKEIASLLLKEMAVLADYPHPETVPAQLGEGLVENCTLRFHDRLRTLHSEMARGNLAMDSAGWLSQPSVRDFLGEFGHQTTSWDIMMPTLGEQPERLSDLLRLAGSELVSQDNGGSLRSGQAREDLLNRLGREPWEQEMAREACSIMRTFMSLDEEHHFHTGRIIPVTRQLVLKLGQRLVQCGAIGSPQEVFWLTDGEVRELLSMPSPQSRIPLVRLRQQAWERSCRLGPPRLSPKAGVVDGPGSSEVQGCWQGTGVSSGVVRGRVKKLSGLADLPDLISGDILLVRSPDPALAFSFGCLAGLIAETGAMLSHGAVAAREYRLPAVFACRGIWRDLENGDLVELDGSRGTVCLMERKPA